MPGADHHAPNLDWTGEEAFETLAQTAQTAQIAHFAQIATYQGKSARSLACVVLSHTALGAGAE